MLRRLATRKSIKFIKTKRNSDETWSRLLAATLDEMFQRGFQGMRVDEVLDRTGLHKGAFYHHFASKRELGYAVLDEQVWSFVEQT